MTAIFIDSSGIVKRYVPEVGSAWVAGLFVPVGTLPVYIAAITPVEVVAALARRGRHGSMPPSDVTAAAAQLERDLIGEYRVIDLNPRVVDRAKQIALSHALRGYDSLQLASALETNSVRIAAGDSPLTFVSADAALNAVAAAQGLSVDNPNAHP